MVKARVDSFGLYSLKPDQLRSYTDNDISNEIHFLN